MKFHAEKRLLRIFLLLTIFIPSILHAQTPADAMQRIRSQASLYKIGEASGSSEDEAKKAALENLMMQLRTTFSLDRRETERLDNSGYDAKSESEMRATSIMSVENLVTLAYEDASGWHSMAYISNQDLAEAEERRKDNIIDLIDLGIEQEGRLNIAGALKYYTWALSMLTGYGDDVSMQLEGKERKAKNWLNKHIPMVLDNIEVSLADEEIEYDEFDFDHYSVNLDLKYNGEPVSALDLSYFNGQREIKPVHGKNGRATLTFPDLRNFNELVIKVIYDYPDDGKLYDAELKSLYDGGHRMKFPGRETVKVPIKISSRKVKTKGGASEEQLTAKSGGPVRNEEITTFALAKKQNMATAERNLNAETSPIIEAPKKQIERPIAENADQFVGVIRRVEEALRKRDYESVKSLFTPEGWDLFKMMYESGSIRVVKNADSYKIESSPLFTIGKGIPVSIKIGNHSQNETIVFRFAKDSGLISSVAYALTDRAEKDIFRQALWETDSRYSLLAFMEDYQTAFALKRLDYIKSIFSDDAVIITGSVSNEAKSGKLFIDGMGKSLSTGKTVRYKKFNKQQYINKLNEEFFDKNSSKYRKYIQLVFENAKILKVPSQGYTDSEILWIQLKQQYNSDKYSDKGYLALQIQLRPKGSLIHVRTWSPTELDMDILRKNFSVGK